jgi:protein tyrosine phosphatase (PTP) superfamily phosphohydrolase (DUF442 family)
MTFRATAYLLTIPLLLGLSATDVSAQQPPPLETARNYQRVSDRLASAGQIAYEQIPLLRDEGYDVVVNLATADARTNAEEGFRVTETGLTYVQIPVVWTEPTLDDVEMFFGVMKANEGRNVFVHCVANFRASAFVYLYRTMIEGVPEEEARATMLEVWDPIDGDQYPQWTALLEQAREQADMLRASVR